MGSELVNFATSDKLPGPDWMANIHVCVGSPSSRRGAKDVIKAIKKRMGSKNATVQLYTVMVSKCFGCQMTFLAVSFSDFCYGFMDMNLLPLLLKIVKKKSESLVRERIFLLLDASQTSVGGASGKFTQYYNAYFDLVFPRSTGHISINVTALKADTRTAQGGDVARSKPKEDAHSAVPVPQSTPDLSVIQKASATLHVLREVLDAVDIQHPEGAKDEFTLDLVEQCSYQKQRVMQLIITCRDEKVLSKVIPLNEQLERVLSRHDALISDRIINLSRKGKARMWPEEEEEIGQSNGLTKSLTISENLTQRPHTRTLSSSEYPAHCTRPHTRTLSSDHPVQAAPPLAGVVIPPPPAKHVKREKFFLQNRVDTSHSSLHN
uniref:Uncharacterized protein n=1 Tax=Kalanchoe fedtschenkoi TaxID=63787 RepID=A0A7N0VBQ3_KALFE